MFPLWWGEEVRAHILRALCLLLFSVFLISFSAFHVPSGCSIPVCALSEVVLVAGGKSSSPTRISALHSSLTQVTKNFL